MRAFRTYKTYPEVSDFLRSKLGEDLLAFALPTLLHMAATEFSDHVPHAAKVAKLSTYAIEGSVNRGVQDIMGFAGEFMQGLWGVLKEDRAVVQLLTEGKPPLPETVTSPEKPSKETVGKATTAKRKPAAART